MERRNYLTILISLVPLGVTLISMAIMTAMGVNGWLGRTGVAALQFCEELQPGIVKQPANAWSNMSFVLVGLLIAFHGWGKGNTNRYFTMYSTLLVLLGFGSGAMHAFTTKWGAVADVFSMYLYGSFLMSYSLRRFFKLSAIYFLIFYVGITFSLWFLFLSSPGLRVEYPFGLLVAFFGLFELGILYRRELRLDYRWLGLAAVLFGLGFAAWLPSQTSGLLCNPNSLFQGHAVWHILSAMAAGAIYFYYYSERRRLNNE